MKSFGIPLGVEQRDPVGTRWMFCPALSERSCDSLDPYRIVHRWDPMVQNLQRPQAQSITHDFPPTAPTALPVFYRTYSRRQEDLSRETWDQVCDRTLTDLAKLGKFTPEEAALVERMQRQLKALISGRALWVMGTDWIHQSENFSGGYNCTSTHVVDWDAFGLMMDLAMMGCGTGAILEPKYIDRLPAICNRIELRLEGDVGSTSAGERMESTVVQICGNGVHIKVGDSRRGWVDSYQTLMELASDPQFGGAVDITVDLSDVRPAGEKLKGFGGVANPVKLTSLYSRCAAILNRVVGRKLNSVECCLLIDEAASCIVAGNIRRSAGMRQFDSEDHLGSSAKDNLWQQDANGNWRIDPDRDALRMANHTRVFHRKPTLEECTDAVRKQFYSGEGAIQWAGEAVARANRDLIKDEQAKREFLRAYVQGSAKNWLKKQDPKSSEAELEDRVSRYGLNPCVTADTWIHTGDGPQQVKDLIGIPHSTYVNGELFSTTQAGFFATGSQPVFNLVTHEGYQVRLTGNHRVLKVTAQTQKTQYSEWIPAQDLQSGDQILLHDHRNLQPWDGAGTFADGWAKGSHSTTSLGSQDGSQQGSLAVALKPYKKFSLVGDNLAIEKTSFDFHRGFLQAIFDSAAIISDSSQSSVQLLGQTGIPTIQRMLLRLGIPICVDGESGLSIRTENLVTFQKIIGFRDPEKSAALQQLVQEFRLKEPALGHTATFIRLDPDGIEPVYDCTVPGPARFDGNGFVLHNCGEIIGANFHCVSGDTLLITRDGLQSIGSLVGQSVEVWNGKRWSQVRPILTGQNRQLYRVSFGDGTWLDVTEKHRFFVKNRFQKNYVEMTTADLQEKLAHHPHPLHTEPFQIEHDRGSSIDPIWAYTLGQLVGDGSLCLANGKPQLQLRLYGEKSYQSLTLAGRTSGIPRYYASNPETPCLLYTGFQNQFDPEQVRQLKYEASSLEPLATWNREGILHFVAGLIDADGSETVTGGIRLYLSGYDRAYRVYLLLLKCGIRSSVNLVARAGSSTNLGIRRKDLWYLQITDGRAIPCQRVNTSKGHLSQAKGKHQIIRSVQPIEGLHDTFCFEEPEFHKAVFGGTLTGQCNLSEVHLNQIDPKDSQEQEDAFTAAALSVAALLNHQFVVPRYQQSRQWDPIVGVSFTGLFDFFVHAFGVDWLQWWQAGRPDTVIGLEYKKRERAYLQRWRDIVHSTVWAYCDTHQIRRPNRCTTVQPSGTKSLLTSASPGWHPPKAQRYIRRITFAKGDPVALACIDYGYSVVPSQSDKDEQGNLLKDPFDPRVTEWLVELPVQVPWANLPGADEVEIEGFSALAQFDFYMQVQQHWTTHNSSATLELREDEIEALAEKIYAAIQADEGYMSAALLARFDAPFPRLPFEKIDKDTYENLSSQVQKRRVSEDFLGSIVRYDRGEIAAEGPAGCDAMGCLMPEATP